MSKSQWIAAGSVLAMVAVGLADTPPAWEDQSVFRVNTEVPHAVKMPFSSSDEARKLRRMESPWAMLLNGDWKFHWSGTYDGHSTVGDFYRADFDDSQWDTIPVPSNVELEGYGTPLYVSAGYVIPKDPPHVGVEPPEGWTTYTERQPIMAYRRTFSLPADWKGREIFITFNGVESAFRLWINGREVGYSQDSRTPAEFNITDYLTPGENQLAVEVHRFSDGTYLEDQDFWHLSGIFRDVYLWSGASLDLRDFEVQAVPDESLERGRLTLKSRVRNYGDKAEKYTLNGVLVDARKRVVGRLKAKGDVAGGEEQELVCSKTGLKIRPWSAEEPNLYTLVIRLKGKKSRTVSYYSQQIGFKRQEIRNGNLLINGQPVLIKGVNRHDHHHVSGHYITEETMRAELDAMKRLNINAIRTSHYPNDPRFLELVNEYGFYVISEANIETHGFGSADPNNLLANDRSWYPAMEARVEAMLETFKNQPCIFAWSLGNESGSGPNFEKLAGWIHARDMSRPVHYEGARAGSPPYGYVDFVSPMYYWIASLEPWCREMEKKPLDKQKPLIQCEYSHAMGNSCGGLDEYWALIRSERLLQGGFIWDWRDQGILQSKALKSGEKPAVAELDPARFMTTEGMVNYFAYGGDFNDEPNSDNFCMNGVVGSDLVPNPHAVEVAYQYRSILTTGVDLEAKQPEIRVFNENFFVPLQDQALRWTLLENGRPVAEGEMTIDQLAPQAESLLKIPVPEIEVQPDAEYHLNVEYPQGADRSWAGADYVIARDQLSLRWNVPSKRTYDAGPELGTPEFQRKDGLLTLQAGKVAVVIDEKTAQLISYRMGNREYLKKPLELNFWRPPNDNDRGLGSDAQEKLKIWRDAGPRAVVTNSVQAELELDDHYLGVAYDLTIPAGKSAATLRYIFCDDGALGVSLTLTLSGEELPVVPRIGFQCSIAPEFSNWSWFGRGPEENYSDRNAGTFVGQWDGDVHKLWFPYTEPQETANRTDVRESAFLDGEGHGLCILANGSHQLEIAAYPFFQSDLEGMRHPADIPLRDLITVQIAQRQMGVGGENSWGAWPRPDHLIQPDTYEFGFVLRPQ